MKVYQTNEIKNIALLGNDGSGDVYKRQHLRSTKAIPGGNFIESSHLEGRGHLIDLIRIFEKENGMDNTWHAVCVKARAMKRTV